MRLLYRLQWRQQPLKLRLKQEKLPVKKHKEEAQQPVQVLGEEM